MTGVFPDLTGLSREAEEYVVHPDFDEAMLAFCRGLAYFHSVDLKRRAGVVDTVTWAVTLLVLYLDAHAPQSANASQVVAICAEGKLAGATAVRNAIALLQRGGMVVGDEPPVVGRARRLRPTPALVETMHENLAIRFSAMEPVIAWPKPAMEWARTEGVLAAFVRGNVEAYRRERHILFEHFPRGTRLHGSPLRLPHPDGGAQPAGDLDARRVRCHFSFRGCRQVPGFADARAQAVRSGG